MGAAMSAGRIHVDVAPSAKSCTRWTPMLNCLDTLLLQPDFQPDGGFFNLRLMERGLGDELFKVATSVGALEQHVPERQRGADAAIYVG
jgi:hypothetical protein